MPWFRGNFHCHSTNSDGHASPVDVARYYRAVGMDFVGVSDHNHLTRVEEYREVLDERCIGIPCCEYTGERDFHVLGVDVRARTAPDAAEPGGSPREREPIEILQDGVFKVRAAGGVPVLCHPCWHWAYDHEMIARLEHVRHFEVFNAAPDCNSYPVDGASATERIWDRLLGAGHRVFGAGSDDAHWYDGGAEVGRPPGRVSLGGTGWNVIKAPALSAAAIREAFAAGHFYVSTGVHLADYRVTRREVAVEVKRWSREEVVIEFVGRDGEVLHRAGGLAASYRFRGDEPYVRCRISDSSRCFALTQPVFPDSVERDVEWTQASIPE